MGITLDIVCQSYENMDQSKINYRMRRDLPKLFDKKREDPVWQLALTEGSPAKKARTDAPSLHKAIDGLQVGDRVIITVQGCEHVAEGYPAGLWPAKVIGKLKGNRVKIEWMQVVVTEFTPSAFRCMNSHDALCLLYHRTPVVHARAALLHTLTRIHTHNRIHTNHIYALKPTCNVLSVVHAQSVPGSKDWDTERASHELQKDLIYKLRQDIELLEQQLDVSRGEQRPLQALAEDVRRKFRL